MQITHLRDHPHLAPAIAAHLHATWGELAPWSELPTIEQRLLAASAGAPFPHTLIALQDDGRFAGTASVKLRELEHHSDKEHWLGEVFVPPEFRQRGLGALLTTAAARYAFDHGVDALYLYTPDRQKLYAGLGWVPCAEDHVHGEVVTIMVRHRSA